MSPTEPHQIDQLLVAKWVIPVVPARQVLHDHAIAIDQGRIVGLCPADEAASRFEPAQRVELPSHALIPGLVNAHGHSPMSLFRGVADDIPLMEWLEQRIWPLEGRLVDREFVAHGAMLAIAEMIRGGTTTFADMYFFPDAVAEAAIDAQLRVQLACPVLDFPTIWAQDADEYIHKATLLHDEYRSHELVSTAFGPHAPYTVSDAPLRKLATLAEELDVPVHMHVHETAKEVTDAVQESGLRPLQRLKELGLISPRLLCVHATELIPEELALLGDLGASVVHCPESNMKLASGSCPVAALSAAGVNVALGTDGAASNNDLDMLGEMRSAALLAKLVAQDASALPAWQALELATLGGARALGMGSELGSLESGKSADITAVDMDHLNNLPHNNPLSHLVYSSSASQVSHVWCAGKMLLQEGQLRTVDRDEVNRVSALWQRKLAPA